MQIEKAERQAQQAQSPAAVRHKLAKSAKEAKNSDSFLERMKLDLDDRKHRLKV